MLYEEEVGVTSAILGEFMMLKYDSCNGRQYMNLCMIAAMNAGRCIHCTLLNIIVQRYIRDACVADVGPASGTSALDLSREIGFQDIPVLYGSCKVRNALYVHDS